MYAGNACQTPETRVQQKFMVKSANNLKKKKKYSCFNNLVQVCAHHPRDFIGLQETSGKVNQAILSTMTSKKLNNHG